MLKMMNDIKEFHEKFGLTYDGKPRAIPEDMSKFRHKFGIEEVDERHSNNLMALASDPTDIADYTHHLAEGLDAIIDELYVAFGTAYLHGFSADVLEQAWERVHERNMAKERATSADQSKRGSTLDVIKPPGWYPPKHDDLVENHDRA